MSTQKFLDYDLVDCGKPDGVVLEKSGKIGLGYETHLGNYGQGEDGFNNTKKAAIVYFMLARPNVFATTIFNKVMRAGSGTMHEFFLLKKQLETEGIPMPEEITCIDGMNCMIGYKGETLTWEPVAFANVDRTAVIKQNVRHLAHQLLNLVGEK